MNRCELVALIICGVVLFCRHVPQLIIDLRQRERRLLRMTTTWARAWMIMCLYIAVLAVTCLRIAEMVSARGPLLWIGAGLICVGGVVGGLGVWGLGDSYNFELIIATGARFVSQGIYSIVRHPQRLGLSLEVVGLIILASNVWLVGLLILIIVLQVVRTIEEERMLDFYFGDAYRQYTRTVPSINLLAGVLRAYRRKIRGSVA